MFNDRETQIQEIKEIFAEAESEQGWNATGEMLYSFYFVDESVEKLEKLGEHLEKEGFTFVNIYELGDEENNEPTGEFLLHLDKVENHSPESLAERNLEFEKLAGEFEIETYDGWEFGEDDDFEDEDE
ncbi:hypothetical protein BH20ACI4_BH20ACI4_24560 [soil metagenome]